MPTLFARRPFYELKQIDPDFWEPADDPFDRPIEDDDVRRTTVKCKKEKSDDFDLARDMLRAAKSLNGELISKIAERITAEDVKALIRERVDEEMRRIIYAGLGYQRIGNASDDMKRIVAATKEALRLLALESPLNATRARKFGIALDVAE